MKDTYKFSTEYMALLFLAEIENDGDLAELIRCSDGTYDVIVEVSNAD